MKQQITSQIVLITPELAAQYLESNTSNRHLRMQHVDTLVKALKDGTWEILGDSICFDEEDKLINGQHRLTAICRAGIAAEVNVMRGLSRDAFAKMDSGIKRSPADVLTAAGEVNSTKLSSVLRLLHQYYTGKGTTALRITSAQTLDLLELYPDAREVSQRYRNIKFIQPAVFGACCYIFNQIDSEGKDEFMEAMLGGAGLSSGNPYHVLRERLIKQKMSTTTMMPGYMLALCIKAWNFRRQKKSIRALAWNATGKQAEDFPIAK